MTAISLGQAGTERRRVGSIDAYRGLVMLLMMAEVLVLARVSRQKPESRFWAFLAHHQSHAPWQGCSLHDLIQPSFSFLVGVALPFSIARRVGEGQSGTRRTLHAFWRALVLVLLGVFLRSIGHRQTYWTFEDTLTQIGLGYGFLYLLAGRSIRAQISAIAIVLLGYWLLFALYPIQLRSDLPNQLDGFASHWSMNTNVAWRFDTWFLNLFPRQEKFEQNSGGYCTLSFIPTLATMLLGSVAGSVLRSDRSGEDKLRLISIAGISLLAAGWLLEFAGVCPIVKRIWTPSWVLFSGGWCFVLLAMFYFVIEVLELRAWAMPLIVIGMNSIAAYLIAHLCPGFFREALLRHIPGGLFGFAGKAYEPLMIGAGVLLLEWLVLWWMYRRRSFLRI